MPKPSQPATPNNSIHTHNTQPTPELFTRSFVLQRHSRHPPNHAIFRSHKPPHIIHFHRPSFATIYKHPLYTRTIYLSYILPIFTRCPFSFNLAIHSVRLFSNSTLASANSTKSSA